MQKIIECVPNFSEGRDMNIIKQITDAIESVDGQILGRKRHRLVEKEKRRRPVTGVVCGVKGSPESNP